MTGWVSPGELCEKQEQFWTPTPHIETHKILEMRILVERGITCIFTRQ